MAKQKIVYIVEYQVSARDEVYTHVASVALTMEQLEAWMSIWPPVPSTGDRVEDTFAEARREERLHDVEQYIIKEGCGGGLLFFHHLMENFDPDLILQSVRDGRKSCIREFEEGLLGFGQNYKRLMSAMRRVELSLDTEISDFDNAQFKQPPLPNLTK